MSTQEQPIELADGGAGALAPQLEHAADSFIGFVCQDGGYRTLVEAGQLMSVPLDVGANPFDLVDGGDLAIGKVGDLSVELDAFVAR